MNGHATALEGVPLRQVLATDAGLAAAFDRLLKTPALTKIDLTSWEFELACNAPIIYDRFGTFTWKQRRALRQIAKKIAR